MNNNKLRHRPFCRCLLFTYLMTLITLNVAATIEHGWNEYGFALINLIFPFTFLPFNYLLIIIVHYIRLIPYIFMSKLLIGMEVIIWCISPYIASLVFTISQNTTQPDYKITILKVIVYLIVTPLLILLLIRVIFNEKFRLRSMSYDSMYKELNVDQKNSISKICHSH